MKTFQQFQESIGKLRILPTLVKGAIATYGIKKGAEYLGKKKGESEIKKPESKKSDPIKDLIPNIKKRNKALEDAINKS
tara:strand:- start:366 stop:602 length:237 start_codon:yes stop_codon:yes gene_type:complete